jgi:hypothetical protein
MSRTDTAVTPWSMMAGNCRRELRQALPDVPRHAVGGARLGSSTDPTSSPPIQSGCHYSPTQSIGQRTGIERRQT